MFPVKEAYGRIIAENITSNVNIPPFDVSHFDGPAVRAEDTSKASLRRPVLLKVVCQRALIDVKHERLPVLQTPEETMAQEHRQTGHQATFMIPAHAILLDKVTPYYISLAHANCTTLSRK